MTSLPTHTTTPSPVAPPTRDPAPLLRAYEEHHAALYRYCRALLRNDHDAQDALQEAVVKALAAWQRDARVHDFKPWLYRIAHNAAMDVLRGRRVVEPVAEVPEEPGEGLDVVVERRERLAHLDADLAALPPKQRSALVLRELNGLGHDEIAEVLGSSPRAVKQTIYEARVALDEADEGRGMTCATIQQALSDGDGRVRRGRRVRGHLRSCKGCKRFALALEHRPGELRALVPAVPPVAAAALVAHALGGGAVAGLVGGGGAGAGAVAAGGGAVAVGGGALAGGGAGVGATAAGGSVVAGGAAAGGSVGAAGGGLASAGATALAAKGAAALALTAAAVGGGVAVEQRRDDPAPARPARSAPPAGDTSAPSLAPPGRPATTPAAPSAARAARGASAPAAARQAAERRTRAERRARRAARPAGGAAGPAAANAGDPDAPGVAPKRGDGKGATGNDGKTAAPAARPPKAPSSRAGRPSTSTTKAPHSSRTPTGRQPAAASTARRDRDGRPERTGSKTSAPGASKTRTEAPVTPVPDGTPGE